MEALGTLDARFFLFLNGLHTDWMDMVMIAVTQMWVWLPLYLLMVYWTVKHYGKRCWWIFIALGIVILCSDQLSAHVCKPLFQRLRPCYNVDFQDLIYLPKGVAGGKYGFVSSHAANTFAIAAFMTAALRNNRPWVGIVLYLWALISSYSRIYLGFHYPGDILCGAVLGILIGLIFWKVFQLVFLKRRTRSEQ